MVDLDNVQIRYSLRLMTLLAYDVIFVNVCKKNDLHTEHSLIYTIIQRLIVYLIYVNKNITVSLINWNARTYTQNIVICDVLTSQLQFIGCNEYLISTLLEFTVP